MLLIGITLLLLATAISFKVQNNYNNYLDLLSFNNKMITKDNKNVNYYNYSVNRITILLLLYSAYISFITTSYENLKDGIGVYNGLFQISTISQNFDCFLYLMGGIVLSITAFNRIYSAQTTFNFDKFNRGLYSGNETIKKNKISELNIKDNLETVSLEKKEINSVYNNNLPSKFFSFAYDYLPHEYCLITLFSIIGGSLLLSSNDMISMYISIELQSFALYILATIYRDSQNSVKQGMKYFLLGGLSSCFILLGSGIIYATTGLTNLEGIYILYTLNIVNKYIGLGILFILTGFLFKISAAPFHNWAIDVYDGVPTVVTTWLSVITKISILIFLLHLIIGTGDSLKISNSMIEEISIYKGSNVLFITTLLSLIIGTIVGLVQYRIKRLLVYSTVSHIGFLTFALFINTEESYESFLFYLIQYTISNANNFFIILAFGYLVSKIDLNLYDKKIDIYSPISYIDDLKGEFLKNPVLSLCFAISLFSLAGLPPLIGFFGKQLILLNALYSGYISLTIIAIIVSVISGYYYLRIIQMMFFEDKSNSNIVISLKNKGINVNDIGTKNIGFNEFTPKNFLNSSISFFISVFTLFILFFSLKPYLILNWAHLLAISIFYN